jgi:hypothetical protein
MFNSLMHSTTMGSLLVLPAGNACRLLLHTPGQASTSKGTQGAKNRSVMAAMATRRQNLQVKAGLKVLVIKVTFPAPCKRPTDQSIWLDAQSAFSTQVWNGSEEAEDGRVD